MLLSIGSYAQQNVGIGTSNPNTKAILQLSSTTQGFLPPVMNNDQMNAITSPPPGLMIYNNQTQCPMVYAQRGWQFNFVTQNYTATYGWFPVSTGPRMIAWGSVDSIGTSSFPDSESGTIRIKSGSGNFTVLWNGDDRWFELTVMNVQYTKDSMLLIINPVGNGSHDQIVSTGELLDGGSTRATIKFTDVSRMISNFSSLFVRRRSEFHFVLYSLKRDPF